jgi:hypothetical protein
MYAVQPQCENLILGVTHDNGYALLLSKLEAEGVKPGKVILLQGAGFAPELDRFDSSLFPRVRFGELFMEKKLEVGKKYSQVAAADNISPVLRKSISPKPAPVRLAEPELCIPLFRTMLTIAVWLSVKNTATIIFLTKLSSRPCDITVRNNFVALFNNRIHVLITTIVSMDMSVPIMLVGNVFRGRSVSLCIPSKGIQPLGAME